VQQFVQFFVLGLVSGGIYALLATGVVLVYRGAGIVNFAQGGFAMVGAAAFIELRPHMATIVAMLLGVLVSALAGVVVQLGVMWPMRRSSPLVRVVATLALLTAVTQAGLLHYGTNTQFAKPFLNTDPVKLHVANAVIGKDRLIIFGITLVLIAILWAVYRYTRYGLATTALSKNERAVAALGWSPWKLGLANWAVGGALAGFAGILLVPLTGFSPTALSLIIIPTLAAALLGGFSSFPLALLGGVLIGVLQSEATWYVHVAGAASTIPFVVVVVVLVVSGQSLPLRSHLADRLPRLGSGSASPSAILIGLAVVMASVGLAGDDWANAVTTAALYGLICLSLVVLTGYAGQLSLAQFALAGVGALVAAQLGDHGWNFVPAVLVGVLATAVAGSLVALPALRIRGINLAVATMAVAVAISDTLLAEPKFIGGITGITLPHPKILGTDILQAEHPVRYAVVCGVAFAFAALVVSNLRRGSAGRRLIAIRDNERAAASLGISVQRAKIFAFAVGAALAGFGGTLLIFQNSFAGFEQFNVFNSINAVLLAVIGSVGFVSGSVVAGVSAPSGPAQELISQVVNITSQFLLISALLLLLVLYLHPDGIADQMAHQLRWVRERLGLGGRTAPSEAQADAGPAEAAMALEDYTVEPRRLELRGVGKRFGGVAALKDVSLHVDPGEVVGLIGPNGAGKTTLVDVATGFHRRYEGQVLLDDRPLDTSAAHARAQLGLTRSFQSLELFDDLTVRENLLVATDGNDTLSYVTSLVRSTTTDISPAARAAVGALELQGILDRRPPELSYSQRRLVAIARALASGPSVLLLDEPAAGLDEVATTELAQLLPRIAKSWNIGILLIEHDVGLVLAACDRVVVLNFGELLATGTPDEISNDRRVVEAYLGGTPVAVA
jgi:sulfate-transporting ATPase